MVSRRKPQNTIYLGLIWGSVILQSIRCQEVVEDVTQVETSSQDEDYLWPSGSYGIPCPDSGCPAEKNWFSGVRYHKTADRNNMNNKSTQYHLAGPVTKQRIAQVFCIKNTKSSEASSKSGSPYIWSPGKYCIYKYKNCPNGFTEGSYTWDDANPYSSGKNNASGALPDGVYSESITTIQYCCRGDGYSSDPIRLPTKAPFYLFPYASTTCQAVENTHSSLEWVYFDDSDHVNKNELKGSIPFGPGVNSTYNTVLHFCYYTQMSLANSSLNYGMKYGGRGIGEANGGSNSALTPIAGTLVMACGLLIAYKSTPLGGLIRKFVGSTGIGGNILPMIDGVMGTDQNDNSDPSSNQVQTQARTTQSNNKNNSSMNVQSESEEDPEAAHNSGNETNTKRV